MASGVDWEDTNSFPYTSYGPIDQWCFDATLKDFSLLFDQKPVPDNINGWDVSNVENMYGIFREATFNGNISNWDVSKVKDFSFFFYGGNTPPTGDMLNGWDVSNAERMTWMFESTSFNGDVSSWNVSKVVSLTGMFKGSQFNGDLSNWDVSSVTSLVRLFELSKFNRNLSSWDVSSVRSFENTFRYSPFNYDISNWNVVSATKMIGMFNNAADFDKNLCDWGPRLSNLREVTAMFTSTKCPEEGDPDLEATPITPLCHICPAAESFSLSMFGWN